MNYRHAFHAGNFADVTKHALLLRVLERLKAKPAPFRVVDTHAGPGLYDLAGSEAERTGEWRDGVGRLAAPFAPDVEALLAPYRDVLARVRARRGPTAYPGSPAILREALRPADRAVLVEKHPEDAATLRARFNAVANLKTLEGDGWAAAHGLLPPRERRGLVLVDPPYEELGELDRAPGRLAALLRRWPTGVFALWYPVKAPAAVDGFFAALRGAVPAPLARLELRVDRPDGVRLCGSGLAVLNPPWRLDEEAAVLLPALAERLARDGRGAWRAEVHGAP